MKKFFKNTKGRALAVILLFLASGLIYSFSTGITGRTQKGPDPGCICHNATPTTSVAVTINGPDSVNTGQTVSYTVTISGGPLIRGGTDIAVSRGDVNPTNSQLRKEAGELTHTSPAAPSGSTVTFPFTYTAPATTGPDTLFANGNSVNFNGFNTGDQWNFAPNRIITVRNPSAIQTNSTVADKFSLGQNYPNPFNPVTNIKFSLQEKGAVKMIVYDASGRTAATLIEQNMNAGTYTVDFNASLLTSGIYFYRISVDGEKGDYTETRKMMLVK